MNGIDPFLLGGISFIMVAFMLLCATVYYYITTKRFNKYGIVTYGEINGYEFGETYSSGDTYISEPDYLYITFDLENQEHTSTMRIHLPHSNKQRKNKYAKGSKKKIKVLKTKKGGYKIKLIKESKENVGYPEAITLAILTILVLLTSVYFFYQNSSYENDMIIRNSSNTVNYNKTLNNPYIEKFTTLNDETIESMNTKFGVQGKLENPNISQSSYVWEIKNDMKIKGSINSDGKIRSVELEAPDDEFFDSNLKFASDISTLNGKQKITYEEVKAKCGGIDGNPTLISNGKANAYVWVNSEYKLTITIGSNGYVTSLILRPR